MNHSTEPSTRPAHRLVSPCAACRRHIRIDAPTCQFCGADHAPPALATSPGAARRRGSLGRLALAGGAALLVAACGSPETEAESGGDDATSGGGEGSCSGEDSCSGEAACSGEADPQPSCARLCGDHHSPVCDDDGENCVAPPYGAPPMDETVV